MNKRAFILALVGCLCLTSLATTALNPRLLETSVPKVQTIRETRVITKTVKVPVKAPDGRMSVDDCARLAAGTSMHDMMATYGWPVGDNGNYSYSGMLYYPVREAPNDRCVVDMFGGKVNTVHMEDN